MTERELVGATWSGEGVGHGRFRCPHCGEDRGADRTRLQRHLTVVGRPVLRLGRPSEYVTCEACGRAYPTGLADAESGSWAPASAVSEDERCLLAIVSAVVLSDSVVRPVEKAACREVFRRYTGRRLAPEEVDELLRTSRGRWGDPVARLGRLRYLVPEVVRHRILEAAYHVCTADGELHREESILLARIGEALDLGPREVRRALEEAKARPVGRV